MDPISPPSPTPIIPAKTANVMWLVWTVLSLVVLPPLIAIVPAEAKWLIAANSIVNGLGNLLRYLTSNSMIGAAKLLVVGLLGLAVVTGSTGCIHFKDGTQARIVRCGTEALQREVVDVMPDVAKAIQGSAVDWQPALNELVARVGDAALCALAVLVQNLEVGGGAGVGVVAPMTPRYPDSVLLMRAYSYQAAHPYKCE